ncbi:leucine-rich repeat and immunoglobulin-like domain-containing nogo receptor-interacting protein 1 [Argiope bruennichi]|uniref:Leucine-rich repeat and immunoglobulin-like n=1 Tax=Argiope bruennichi TaxID=94029 RepID=A0A8T0EB92_ARGBR|nr:leucine-rich repeat and immunoglobulin-like domain-containing nogo receptor-interacting protein 1 [Argiope bruennichi]KAF8768112.1 Leucine-rich repeat and immunoglobulin-like [Argiope bruennichi]
MSTKSKCFIIICIVFVLLPVFISCTIIYTDTQCTSETLEPCKQHPAFAESIYCENINDIKTFVRVLRCGSRKNMQEVFLEKSSLDYLPLYILDFCGFIFLNVKSVVLDKLLEGNVFIKLQQLHLDNVLFRRAWSWEPLKVLERLLRFSVVNMPVQVLNGTLVDNLTDKLKSLILTSTNTTAISDNALQKFTDLEYVSIQNNEITELKRSMFPKPAKIKFFYFGKNKIDSLPIDLFEDMPDLQYIALQGNMISEIHESAFKGIWNNLSSLLLDGNPLKCHCKMLWLAKRKSPAVFTGSCYAPKLKYGKLLKNLSDLDFRCFR